MFYTNKELYEFVRESNAIENITREPSQAELDELERFIHLKYMTVEELEKFVSVYEPKAELRTKYGQDVKVGSYYPPFGGPEIREKLARILIPDDKLAADILHNRYEALHPFTDCNGRSGRALWAWKNKSVLGKSLLKYGFLKRYYYETLGHYSTDYQYYERSLS